MAITTLDGLRTAIDDELATFLAAATPLVNDVDADCAELTGAVADLVSGGKRLRAAFALAGWSTVSGPEVDPEPVLRAGAAFELFQAAALIHDDLIDNSDTRRGLPATHRRIEAWHRNAGMSGDPEAFGRGAGVLAGDLALTWARHLIGQAAAQLPDEARIATLAAWDRMSAQLMGGQFLDLLNQVRPTGEDAVEQARRVLSYKTVQYSVVQPLRIGAAMASAPPQVLESLTGFGTPLGEAFQLRDDLLGVFGDPAVTGKPAGDDLREGKRTVLLALAERHADAAGRDVLTRLIGRPDLDDDEVAQVRTVITGSGAAAQVEEMIEGLHTAALGALARAPFTEHARGLLTELAHSAVRRAS